MTHLTRMEITFAAESLAAAHHTVRKLEANRASVTVEAERIQRLLNEAWQERAEKQEALLLLVEGA